MKPILMDWERKVREYFLLPSTLFAWKQHDDGEIGKIDISNESLRIAFPAVYDVPDNQLMLMRLEKIKTDGDSVHIFWNIGVRDGLGKLFGYSENTINFHEEGELGQWCVANREYLDLLSEYLNLFLIQERSCPSSEQTLEFILSVHIEQGRKYDFKFVFSLRCNCLSSRGKTLSRASPRVGLSC